MGIGWACDAARLDAGIDGAGEASVLDQPHRLAGKIGQSFPLAGRLDPAIVHLEAQRVFIQPDRGLFVNVSVQP